MKEYNNCLKATAIGDFCGSAFSRVFRSKISEDELFDDALLNFKGFRKNRLTECSVCTFAIAAAIMSGSFDYKYWLKRFCKKYSFFEYGDMFADWLNGRKMINDGYGSWGSGGPMRCTPIAWYASTIEECDKLTEDSLQCTHNSVICNIACKLLNKIIFMAKNGADKETLVNELYKILPQWKDITLDNYVEYFKNKNEKLNYSWYIRADNVVYIAIKCFEESNCFEDAIKLAIQQGFDTNIEASITANIAYAYYKKIPSKYVDVINQVFTPEMELINDTFCNKFINYDSI